VTGYAFAEPFVRFLAPGATEQAIEYGITYTRVYAAFSPLMLIYHATGTSQIVGMAIVATTAVNSVPTVRNPAGNATALTITPLRAELVRHQRIL
jgi:Na+-driven multidrug efflux pump